jgi:hypothetical protein
MKPLLPLWGLTLAVCALVCAQDTTAGRVVVPARNTTQPRVVNAASTHGNITVKTYNGREVIVETPSSSRSERRDQTVDGLHRIDLPARGLVVEEEDNVITVRASTPGPENLVITVPVDTSLHLRSTHGNVEADGVHGEVEGASTNGRVTLTNISGTVVASSTNGSLKIDMDRVDPGKPMSFSSVNGSIDVTLPADTKANLKLRAVHGSVWSDFDMKLTGGQPATTTGNSDVRYRLEFDRTIYGSINGGGAEASFYTVNGRITIRKK